MSRVQLAINVSDLDEAISFYSKFFNTQPAKVRAGYANFAINEPPLKLVLIEGAGEPGSINHLGVEVFSSEEVVAATTRLSDEGMATDIEESTTCCYAVQNKVWVSGPDSSRWEVYTVLADATTDDGIGGDGQCCASPSNDAALNVTARACC
jgi:predicted enzyme related to lactoylglutathione lyase